MRLRIIGRRTQANSDRTSIRQVRAHVIATQAPQFIKKKLLYVQGSAIVNHGMCSFGLKHARLCHMNMPNGLGACIGRLVLQYG